MKKFILVFLSIFFLNSSALAAPLTEKVLSSNNKITSIMVYKNKVVFEEDDFLTKKLRIYNYVDKTIKVPLNSSVPFESISFNDNYIVWSQRSARMIDDKTTWQIYAYDIKTDKSLQVTKSDKLNKYPFMWKDYVIFYESTRNGNSGQIIKLHIPTLKRSILVSGLDVNAPKALGKYIVFSTSYSKKIHVLDMESGRLNNKINTGIELNDAAITTDGVIWSTSNQEYSTSSELYEYLFSTKKIVKVISGLSWGKGSNYINPIRLGNLVFYLSGVDKTGFDLWQHDLIKDKQYPIAKDVVNYSVSDNLLAYISGNNLFVMPIKKENYIPGGSTKSHILPTIKITTSKQDYHDIKNHWAQSSIMNLIKKEIASGDKNEDGALVFRPEDRISRAEFVTLLANTLNIKGIASSSSYRDISNHWAQPFIEALNKKGAIKGTLEGYFRPEQKITRAEASAIIARLNNTYSRRSLPYKDIDSTHWAFEEISGLTLKKIISGYNDKTYKPNNNLTRAEAAVIMNRLLDQ